MMNIFLTIITNIAFGGIGILLGMLIAYMDDYNNYNNGN